MFSILTKIFGPGDHLFKKKYGSYQEYLDHQKAKTLDPVRREKWLNDEWQEKYLYFLNEFIYK